MEIKLILNVILLLCLNTLNANDMDSEETPPDGYYAFIESPSSLPPKVKPPPYTTSNKDCLDFLNKKPYVSANNVCGDLNKGKIPRNPMGQLVLGEIYPFELIRNQTLKFLSKTLPILKVDDTLPKVTQVVANDLDLIDNNNINKRNYEENQQQDYREDYQQAFEPAQGSQNQRQKRHARNTDYTPEELEAKRKSRKFCDGGGVFCALYRAVQGEPISSQLMAERREESVQLPAPRYEGPPTPCPAKVEYVTPVFAKNYQGSWRYVVQIPYEGYFTQTVEVTRCLQTKCHYLDGGCLSSPRWVSMLVAEIFYPNAEDENQSTSTVPPMQDFHKYQEYLQRRAGVASNGTDNGKKQSPVCDGIDEIGCFQIRLYYDWFLIPGSCKCWRPDYFAKYVRKRPITPEL